MENVTNEMERILKATGPLTKADAQKILDVGSVFNPTLSLENHCDPDAQIYVRKFSCEGTLGI